MAYAGVVGERPRFRVGIPKIKISFKVECERIGGGGGDQDPEDKRGVLRHLRDGLRRIAGGRRQ